jgi:hypothetical protein
VRELGQVGRAWGGERKGEQRATREGERGGPRGIGLLGWFVLFQSLFYLLFWSSNLNLSEFKTKFEFNPRHSLK